MGEEQGKKAEATNTSLSEKRDSSAAARRKKRRAPSVSGFFRKTLTRLLSLPPKHLVLGGAAVLLAVAGAVLVTVSSAPSFTELPVTLQESLNDTFLSTEPSRRTCTPAAFDEAFGTQLASLTLSEFSGTLLVRSDGRADKGSASFLSGDCSVSVGYGERPLPASLAAVKKQTLDKKQVCLVRDKATGLLFAGYEANGVSWTISASLSQGDFLAAVRVLLKDQ